MVQNVNIMVIDDEPSVLESFKMILKIKDYEVETFPDGPAALQNLTKGKYDVAFVDYKLPVMDGLEVLRRIKEIDPDIEVIIVTAYATDASHANAITLGALESAIAGGGNVSPKVILNFPAMSLASSRCCS